MSLINSPDKLGHIPSLDGLRAIAVSLVLLAHANFQLGENGILGVDVFFALSGFLITTLLLEEYRERGEISLKAFYVRRIFRLFPALYAMLLVLIAYAFAFKNSLDLSSLLKEILSSALYLNNISWSWGWGDKGILLAHTWSLAVEEQFYLLWPWFLLLGLYFRKLQALIFGLLIFILFIFWMKNFGSVSYIFNSLFYESIFIGCLAALLRWYMKSKKNIPDYFALFLLFILVIIGVWPIDLYKSIYQVGGRSIMAILTSIVIMSLVNNREGITSKLLSLPPMIWVGKISYALYLWHVPVFAIFRNHSTLPPSLTFVLKFIVTFVCAGISWFFIEKKATILGRDFSKRIWSKTDNKGSRI